MKKTIILFLSIFILTATASAAPQKPFIIEYKETPTQNSSAAQNASTAKVIFVNTTSKNEAGSNTRKIIYDPNNKEYPIIYLSLGHTTLLRFSLDIKKAIPGNREIIYSDITDDTILILKPKDYGPRTDVKIFLENKQILNFELDISDNPNKGDRIVDVKITK